MFSYCPACGEPKISFDGKNRYHCDACGFLFYQNTAAACGAILALGSEVLLLRRGKEPAIGMLDFPGGFIDPGESAESALQREILEEIGVNATNLRYFWSAPNRYTYSDVTYPTCDLVFTGTIQEPPAKLQENEIDGYVFLSPAEIQLEEIAFPSLRTAMDAYISRWSENGAWLDVDGISPHFKSDWV